MLGPLLKVQMWFCVAGARDSAPCQKWAKREGFATCPKTMAGVGHLQRICKDAFRVAGAVQETCLSEMLGGQGADFLREVAFWSIKSSGLLRWFCVTGAALRMTWHHFCVAGAALYTNGMENRKTHWRRPSALHWRKSRRFASFLMLSKLFCFWCCQVQKLKKSRRIALFWMLSSAKKWGSLAELFRFWRCQVQ